MTDDKYPLFAIYNAQKVHIGNIRAKTIKGAILAYMKEAGTFCINRYSACKAIKGIHYQ